VSHPENAQKSQLHFNIFACRFPVKRMGAKIFGWPVPCRGLRFWLPLDHGPAGDKAADFNYCSTSVPIPSLAPNNPLYRSRELPSILKSTPLASVHEMWSHATRLNRDISLPTFLRQALTGTLTSWMLNLGSESKYRWRAGLHLVDPTNFPATQVFADFNT